MDARVVGCRFRGSVNRIALPPSLYWWRYRSRMEPRRADQDFTRFVVDNRAQSLRLAYLLMGDSGQAEDLVQAALLRLYRQWDRVAAADQPVAYARRAVVNQGNSWWRSRLAHPVSYRGDMHDGAAAGDVQPDVAAAVTERDELWSALRTLPRGMRAVVVLRYYEDLSEADTARTLGISPGTVKTQASRGLARMRQALPADDARSAVPAHRYAKGTN